MNLVKEEKLNKPIDYIFNYNFEVMENGLYLIEISARAKSWLQNLIKFISFFQDDDLEVKIDHIEFDSKAAWNGNQLKNLQKINLFFVNLEKGTHFLHFTADQSPLLENIKIYQAENKNKITLSPSQSYQLESGNRRPWLCFTLVNLALEKLAIKASANKTQSTDDNDLQLRIDGQRQINSTSKSHQYWYWCGRVLNGQSKTFDEELNLPTGLHYLEWWTDNQPILEKVELDLSRKYKGAIEVKPYNYKGVFGNEDYNRYDTAIKDAVDYWNGEFLNDPDPPKEPLDPNLVKATVYVESRMGYEKREKEYYPSYPDIMQSANPDDKAIHVLHNDGKWPTEYEVANEKPQKLFYPQAKANTPHESIKWEVRWLYHKAQENIQENSSWHREWLPWKEAVLGYGPGTKEYQDKVWKIYTRGIDPWGNKFWSILLPLLLTPFLLWSIWVGLNQGKTFVTFHDIKGTDDYKVMASILNGAWFQKIQLATTYSNAGNFWALSKKEPIKISYLDIDKDGQNEILISGKYIINSTHYLLKNEGSQYRIIYHNGEFDDFREAFVAEKLEFKVISDDPNLQAVESTVIPYYNAPDQLWTSYHFFDEKEGNYKFYKTTKEDLH